MITMMFFPTSGHVKLYHKYESLTLFWLLYTNNYLKKYLINTAYS